MLKHSRAVQGCPTSRNHSSAAEPLDTPEVLGRAPARHPHGQHARSEARACSRAPHGTRDCRAPPSLHGDGLRAGRRPRRAGHPRQQRPFGSDLRTSMPSSAEVGSEPQNQRFHRKALRFLRSNSRPSRVVREKHAAPSSLELAIHRAHLVLVFARVSNARDLRARTGSRRLAMSITSVSV